MHADFPLLLFRWLFGIFPQRLSIPASIFLQRLASRALAGGFRHEKGTLTGTLRAQTRKGEMARLALHSAL